jgi:hypothetical protein
LFIVQKKTGGKPAGFVVSKSLPLVLVGIIVAALQCRAIIVAAIAAFIARFIAA